MNLNNGLRFIFEQAYLDLHEEVHNVNSLQNYLQKSSFDSSIEFTLFLIALYRAKEISSIFGKEIPYPVFGKEMEMAEKEAIVAKIKTYMDIDKILLVDSEIFSTQPLQYWDENLHLLEQPI